MSKYVERQKITLIWNPYSFRGWEQMGGERGRVDQKGSIKHYITINFDLMYLR
jgi:hypothetical protein